MIGWEQGGRQGSGSHTTEGSKPWGVGHSHGRGRSGSATRLGRQQCIGVRQPGGDTAHLEPTVHGAEIMDRGSTGQANAGAAEDTNVGERPYGSAGE